MAARVKEGDTVWVEDEHGNKKRGTVLKIKEQHPGDQYPGILVEWTTSAWFNVNEVTPVHVVDQLGDLAKDQ